MTGSPPRSTSPDFYEVREKALLAHATQVDPTSPFWFGLPTEVARDAHPYDDYILARSLVDPTDGSRGRPVRRGPGPV